MMPKILTLPFIIIFFTNIVNAQTQTITEQQFDEFWNKTLEELNTYDLKIDTIKKEIYLDKKDICD